MLNPSATHSYIWLFFLYGLAFYSLGISALQQKLRHSSEFPLMRWIHLLGFFGLLQGVSEWIIMMRVMGVYSQADQVLYLAETFTNAFSFVFLCSFAIALLAKDRIRHLNLHIWLPGMVFVLWNFFYLGRYYAGATELYSHMTLFNRLSRYLLGFPGGIMAGIAYFLNGRQMMQMKLNRYAWMYAGGGILFFLYGFSAGLVVSPPASAPMHMYTLETQVMTLWLPVEFIRAISAVGITIVTIRLFDSFGWELQERLKEYEQQQAVLQERKKMIRVVHDQIIQRLFGAGIQIENMMGDEETKERAFLQSLKGELNETIHEARQFLHNFTETRLVMEDFNENLQNLVERFRINSDTELTFDYRVPVMVLGRISSEKNTQLYFIIQEALLNVQKHAQANHAALVVTSSLQELEIRVEDDGIGIPFNLDPSRGFGIKTMRERADQIGAELILERKHQKTCVVVRVPWEEREE